MYAGAGGDRILVGSYSSDHNWQSTILARITLTEHVCMYVVLNSDQPCARQKPCPVYYDCSLLPSVFREKK